VGNAADSVSIFTGIGRLRIPLAGGGSVPGGSGISAATLILTIAFPYPPDDRPFSEELASKIGEFRAIAMDYFSALPAEKLANLDEGAAKIEILSRYNAGLRLGKIQALYFSDLMIVE
jgi:flagellar basal body-associated protein FliL